MSDLNPSLPHKETPFNSPKKNKSKVISNKIKENDSE